MSFLKSLGNFFKTSWAPILGAGQLAGNLITNANNNKSVRETNEAQKQLAIQQHEWNVQDYEQQLADQDMRTDPAYIIARLRNAGLNPYTYFAGDTASASMASATQPTLQAYQADNFMNGVADSMSNGLRTQADIAHMEKQDSISETQLNIQKMLSENTVKDSEHRRELENAQFNLAKEQAEVAMEQSRAQIKQIQANTVSAELQNELTRKYGDKLQASQINKISAECGVLAGQAKNLLEDLQLKVDTHQISVKQACQDYWHTLEKMTQTELQNDLLRQSKSHNDFNFINKDFDFGGLIKTLVPFVGGVVSGSVVRGASGSVAKSVMSSAPSSVGLPYN